jgi:predicted metal-dependent phosphoesterase TrpH
MPQTRTDPYAAPREVDCRVDLHLHSSESDGLLTPAAVVEAAVERGLAAIALTDHDTVSGLAEAAAAARSAGLDLAPGIEMSLYDGAGSTHMLGYFIDAQHDGLLEFLAAARESRARRAEEMVRKLNRLGIDLALDAVLAQVAESGLVARPHVARALIDGGWVKSFGEAFDRFIAAGSPAYVPTRTVAPDEGIRLIHAAGGLAVLAHGGRTHDDDRIYELVDAGLDGLEVLHPDHGPAEVRRMRRVAAELGLVETGGSDWHGPLDTRRDRLGAQPVPHAWFERLREAAGAAPAAT